HVLMRENRTHRVRYADKTTNRRQHCQHDQRHCHHPRRLVRRNWPMMMIRLLMFRLISFAKTLTTPKSHDHHSRHVHRGKKCSERCYEPKKLTEPGRRHTESRCTPRLP